MKKLTITERCVLEAFNSEEYNSYICPKHGLYMTRTDIDKSLHCCSYCKEKHPVLTQEQIKDLLLNNKK